MAILQREFFPEILEEGVQHHNRVVTQEAIHHQTGKYIGEDILKNYSKYSPEDQVRLSNLLAKWNNK